jgi:apolipoprotein N-acyltransferase
MNRLILQVFYVIFSGLAQALSIANEFSIFGSPILTLFCLFPMYVALFKSKSYKETLGLVFTQVITVHLVSSFWLANFHGFGIFTLGASAIGTGLQGLVCSVIMHLYPSTITENQKLIENAGNNHFNIFKRILWFSICWTLFEYEKSIGVLGYPWGTIYMGAYKNQAIIQIAEITGVWGISFIHILISSCIAELFLYLENKSHIQDTKSVKKNLKQIFIFSISIYLLTTIFGLSKLMIKENPIKYLNTIIELININYANIGF